MITSDDTLIHNFDTSSQSSGSGSKEGFSFPQMVLVLIVIVVLGITVGYGVTKLKGSNTPSSNQNTKVAQTAGIVDKSTFKDKAEGMLRAGGIDGEGNFHLERPGGISQNVYLTSSTVDLSPYIGKKVRVWGATFQAEKAGWLMDVGLVETL